MLQTIAGWFSSKHNALAGKNRSFRSDFTPIEQRNKLTASQVWQRRRHFCMQSINSSSSSDNN